MSWVRLDDQMPDHPKLLAVGPLGGWLWVCGLAYCNRVLTDGFIPAAQVRKLADIPNVAAVTARLVKVGLWEPVEGGYRVHDYLDYQTSRERALATRAARAEAGQRGGYSKALAHIQQSSSKLPENSQEFASGLLKQNSAPSHPIRNSLSHARTREAEPDPEWDAITPAAAHDLPPPAPPPDLTDAFTAVFDAYPRRHGIPPNPVTGLEAFGGIPPGEWDAVLRGVRHYAASEEARDGKVLNLDKFLRDCHWQRWQQPEQRRPLTAVPKTPAGPARESLNGRRSHEGTA